MDTDRALFTKSGHFFSIFKIGPGRPPTLETVPLWGSTATVGLCRVLFLFYLLCLAIHGCKFGCGNWWIHQVPCKSIKPWVSTMKRTLVFAKSCMPLPILPKQYISVFLIKTWSKVRGFFVGWSLLFNVGGDFISTFWPSKRVRWFAKNTFQPGITWVLSSSLLH